MPFDEYGSVDYANGDFLQFRDYNYLLLPNDYDEAPFCQEAEMKWQGFILDIEEKDEVSNLYQNVFEISYVKLFDIDTTSNIHHLKHPITVLRKSVDQLRRGQMGDYATRNKYGERTSVVIRDDYYNFENLLCSNIIHDYDMDLFYIIPSRRLNMDTNWKQILKILDEYPNLVLNL